MESFEMKLSTNISAFAVIQQLILAKQLREVSNSLDLTADQLNMFVKVEALPFRVRISFIKLTSRLRRIVRQLLHSSFWLLDTPSMAEAEADIVAVMREHHEELQQMLQELNTLASAIAI